jgi:Trk K+ transport system NAD-binding subunit
LLSLRRDGVISEDVFETLTAEVDGRLSDGPPKLPESSAAHTQFVEVIIPPNSQVAGKTVAELGIPRSAVFVSIRRGKELIIPRGDTQIWAGDMVTMLCERQAAPQVKAILLQAR